MTKHRYQAFELQRMDWNALSLEVAGQRLIFSVDVAKENFYGAFLVPPFTVLGIIKWRHPGETPTLGRLLSELPAASIEVALEPSGTYGDSLREFLRAVPGNRHPLPPGQTCALWRIASLLQNPENTNGNPESAIMPTA